MLTALPDAANDLTLPCHEQRAGAATVCVTLCVWHCVCDTVCVTLCVTLCVSVCDTVWECARALAFVCLYPTSIDEPILRNNSTKLFVKIWTSGIKNPCLSYVRSCSPIGGRKDGRDFSLQSILIISMQQRRIWRRRRRPLSHCVGSAIEKHSVPKLSLSSLVSLLLFCLQRVSKAWLVLAIDFEWRPNITTYLDVRLVFVTKIIWS